MNKNLLHSFLFVVFTTFYFASAQSTSNSQKTKELLEEFNNQEMERLNRIEKYAAINPDFKKTLSDSINIIYIYDIIDGKPIYKSTYNLEAGRATKTSQLQPGGSLGLNLDGTGIRVGVWDGGPVQASHPEFANSDNTGSRVTVFDNSNTDGSSGNSSHGTHVAGTISAKGVNPNALGMASNVNVLSYNWTNDEAEMVSAVTSINPIIISNHSYGVPIQQSGGTTLDAWYMGAYSQDARDIDVIARNYPKYLIVVSAGNEGTTSYSGGMYSGYDKLTTDKNAKNNLVVANANPVTAEQPVFSGNYVLTSLSINSGSSQGPTDDLRVKPDIAADGTNLFSPIPTDAYATFSGTSMASPNTAGTLVLLQQYFSQLHGDYMNSSTLKGLICHTSVDDIANVGPDPIFGWGFLDAQAAAQTITDDNSNLAVVEELTLDQGQTYSFSFSAQAGQKLKATICWTDMPGSVATTGVINDGTPRLVNDLDVRLTKDGTTYYPWKLDYSASTGFSNSKADNTVDNIEIIEIDSPDTGTYTLTVTHKGTLQGNDPSNPFSQSQDYSLIITGGNLTLSTNDLNQDHLIIWPNPADNLLNLDLNTISGSDVALSIFDIQGRKVFEERIDSTNAKYNRIKSIDVSSLNSGTYILSIKEGANIITNKKIVIK